MEITLEQRVARLEKKFAALNRQEKKQPADIKDWRAAVGTIPDTPLAREADALGEAYRRAQTDSEGARIYGSVVAVRVSKGTVSRRAQTQP